MKGSMLIRAAAVAVAALAPLSGVAQDATADASAGSGGPEVAKPVADSDALAQMAASLPEGDAERGKAVAGQCRTCHGLNGIARIPQAPNIGAERADYLERQLLAFRSGARVNEMMSVVAGSLDDQEIADAATWFAAQGLVTIPPEGRAAPELCVACHGAAGIAVIPEAPNLAGESAIYIEAQVKAFQNGQRADPLMSPIAMAMTPEELAEAAAFYGAVSLVPAP